MKYSNPVPFIHSQISAEEKIQRLTIINSELLGFAKEVARHFEHTRLPLGIKARAVIAKATATTWTE